MTGKNKESATARTTDPVPPLPFWSWDWKNAGAWRRVYFFYRIVVRPPAVLAAIIGAVLVVVDVVPRVQHTVRPRNIEYAKLAQLHTGYDFAAVRDVLGVPTLSRALAKTGYKEWLFVRDEYFVQVVTDRALEVVILGVTSCNEDFQPQFDVGGRGTIRLQEDPLSTSPDPKASDSDDPEQGGPLQGDDGRSLIYYPGSTATTPENFLEWSGPASNATQGRSYFLGVDPLCVPLSANNLPMVAFQGEVRKAPASIRRFREEYAANTFVETTGLVPVISDQGEIALTSGGYEDELRCANSKLESPDCTTVFAGVYGFGLPPSFADEGTTRTFD